MKWKSESDSKKDRDLHEKQKIRERISEHSQNADLPDIETVRDTFKKRTPLFKEDKWNCSPD